MTGFPAEVDVAILGAGAAGIAAARRLVAAGGVSLLVLEARDRLGGRASTLGAGGMPLDLGCEWLHSADRNALTPIAEAAGFTLYRKLPDWGQRLRRSGESEAEEATWLAAREAHHRAIAQAAECEEDSAAADLLVAGGRWNALLDATSTWANGVELARLSVKDNARYRDSGINWRLVEGYGTLFATLGAAVPVALAASVTRIDRRGRILRLDTARGSLRAARVIVTVPSAVLASGGIDFDPPLDDWLAAASGLPLGLADKLFLGFDGTIPGLPDDSHLIGSTRRCETMSYQVRPFGRPLIACFFGGAFAAAMERVGMAGMAAFAADELAQLCGAAIRPHLRPLAASAWHGDPWAQGSYSYALPGHAEDRARLASPVDGRLFFAGEACSPGYFSTAHGAWETGFAAAESVLASLEVSDRTPR